MLKKDDKIQKKNFPYDLPVEIETRAHGQVMARCPLLPGCQAQGATPKEALEKLKNVIDLYLRTASPALFESLEKFPGVATLYDLAEFRGYLYAATGRDSVLRSSSGAAGSWKSIPITNLDTKFYTPTGKDPEEGGDYVTQVYCLCVYAPPGKEPVLYAGTNLGGGIYRTTDGETWQEAFSTDEDRIHSLCVFKGRLYAGTSSHGKVYAFDGTQWNTVGALSEVAVTSLGVYRDRLYAGTYPSGFLFSTRDGLNWEETAATGQNFIQCFHEFQGAFYAGTSSPKGVKVFRTVNGADWLCVYESVREQNLYCMKAFENTLYVGTGNSGRILKTQDGNEWGTAFAGDEEGVRAFAVFGDYLYAATENEGSLLRSTFDMARPPEITELTVERVTSSTALITWTTDISATTELHYGEKGSEPRKAVLDRNLVLQHRVHLTDLKAECEYEFQAASAFRSSSLSVTESSSFKTVPVPPPALSSPSHPIPGRWERSSDVEILLNPPAALSGYYYLLNHYPETVPAPPEASYTQDRRVALSGTPQGSWYFHVVGVDEAGNIGRLASHYRLQVDTEAAPPVELKSPTHPDPERWVANPTPVVAWETPKDLSGVKGFFLKADHDPTTVPGPGNGDFLDGTRSSLGPLEDGLWYVHVTAQDEAGNLGSQAAHFPLRIDTKALAPTLSSTTHPQPDQWYSNKRVEVEIHPPHDLSGIEGYHYVLDHEPGTLPDTEGSQWTSQARIVIEEVADGQWFLHVRTKDRAGNLSPNAAHLKLSIDTLVAPPKVFSSTHSEDGRWYQNRRVVLNWEDPFEHSGIEGYYYNIDKRADTVPNDKNSLFTSQRSVSFELTDDGLWYFHITTKDKAGNVDWKAVHYPLRVDSHVGRAVITSPTHPDPEAWSTVPKAQFKLTPPDDLSGVTGFYYLFSEDAQAVPDAKNGTFTDKNEINLDIPRDGVHTLAVICQDKAGNLSKEVATYRVRLDTQVGQAVLQSSTHPDPQKWYAVQRVELTWKDPADLSGIEGYYYHLDREEQWARDIQAMTWTTGRGTVVTIPEDGIWFLHLAAKDKAGNIGDCARYSIRIDSSAGVATLKSSTHPPHQWVKTQVPLFQWDPPRELSGVEGYYLGLDAQPHSIPGPGNGKWVTETSLTGPSLKDGKWFFHVVVKDLVGNVGKEAAHYPILIDTQAPKSQMKPMPALLDKTQVYVEWSAVDAHSGVASYDVQVSTNGGGWADWLTHVTETNGVFPGKDAQKYGFRVRARDNAGNVEPYPEKAMASTQIDISAPDPILQLKATPKAGGDIELKWAPVADRISGTDHYRVYRWVEGEPKTKISVDGQVKTTEFLDPGASLKENIAYHYCVQAVDRMGNEQHEGNAEAVSLSDHGVGLPTVTSPTHSSDDWSSQNSVVLVWDAPADATGIAGYYYKLDQSPNARPDETPDHFLDGRRLELSSLESGIWYFHLTAKDRAGNVSSEAAHYRLRIDTTQPSAPQVTSTSHPDPQCWYSSGKLDLHLSSAPKLSGMDSFYYVLDQQENTVPQPSEAQRTTENRIALKVPEAGTWFVHAVAKDRAGNFSEPAHFQVRVASGEMPPPVIHSSTHPSEDEAVNHHDPLFTLEDRHDGSFKPVGYVYKLSPKEKETLTEEDPFTTDRSIQAKDLSEGTWFLHVAAVGKKGKPGQLISRRRIRIQRLGRIGGTFLRKDGITPIPGAKVEMIRGERTAASSVTDPKGQFHLSELPEGRYEIRLYSDQASVLRLKDIPVSAEAGIEGAVFTEDMGIFPTPPKPGPVRFYYFLKEDCNVTLEIFDATGTLVGKVEERKEGGAYAATLWDAVGKPEGEYLVKISAKSITKNAMSRFSVKKFKLQKAVKELASPAVP
ncbi:MAG TPA: hypothetical protein VHE12_13270 [bacterium]|nr:hypothetical protein [bacterium]